MSSNPWKGTNRNHEQLKQARFTADTTRTEGIDDLQGRVFIRGLQTRLLTQDRVETI